jgi:hypothetical protein
LSKLRDAIAYICMNLHSDRALSKARLTKLLYLADWKSAVDHGEPISDIEWEFNHFGPYVHDVIDTVQADPHFRVEHKKTTSGDAVDIVRCVGSPSVDQLDEGDRSALDFAIAKARDLPYPEFKRMVYGTFPIISQPRYSKLRLADLARRYKSELSAASPQRY